MYLKKTQFEEIGQQNYVKWLHLYLYLKSLVIGNMFRKHFTLCWLHYSTSRSILFFQGIDSVWQEWGQWSECSTSCGNGSKVRARACSEPAFGGNDTCVGNSTETIDCLRSECPGNTWYSINVLALASFITCSWHHFLARLGPLVPMHSLLWSGCRIQGPGL